eukprot:759630-Hanusia_phi.AAC.1
MFVVVCKGVQAEPQSEMHPRADVSMSTLADVHVVACSAENYHRLNDVSEPNIPCQRYPNRRSSPSQPPYKKILSGLCLTECSWLSGIREAPGPAGSSHGVSSLVTVFPAGQDLLAL